VMIKDYDGGSVVKVPVLFGRDRECQTLPRSCRPTVLK
jgi:hypothetical protein